MKLRHQEYHVEISGSGPPLLLLHGFTGDVPHGICSEAGCSQTIPFTGLICSATAVPHPLLINVCA